MTKFDGGMITEGIVSESRFVSGKKTVRVWGSGAGNSVTLKVAMGTEGGEVVGEVYKDMLQKKILKYEGTFDWANNHPESCDAEFHGQGKVKLLSR